MSAKRKLDITETAQRLHEELFPNHESTLKVSDPDLIAKLTTKAGLHVRQSLGVSSR
jgi:4-carboxymuconolactone decarboxylase